MRRLINWIFLIYLVFTCNGFHLLASENLNLTLQERNWLKSHSVLRLGIDPAWPPFDFIGDDGKHTGFSADVLARISQKMGVKLQLMRNLSWNQVLDSVKKRELDLISICAQTPERDSYLKYTSAFSVMPWVIATRKDFREIKELSDLKDHSVTMVKGYAVIDMTRRKYPQMKIRETNSPLEGLNDLVLSKTDAYVGNLGVVAHLINEQLLANIKIAANTGFPLQPLRICVRSDWPELISILNKGLKSISTKEMGDIKQKWIPIEQERTKLEDEEGDNLSIILGLFTLIFLLLVGFMQLGIRKARNKPEAFKFGSLTFRWTVIGGLSFFLAIIIVISWFVLKQNREEAINAILKQMTISFEVTNQQLDFWVKNRLNFLTQFGRDGQLVELTEELLKVSVDHESLIKSQALQKIRQFFKEKESVFGPIGFFIINPNSISIGSKRDSNLGTFNYIAKQKPEIIKNVFKGIPGLIPPIRSDVFLTDSKRTNQDKLPATMFFSAPIQKKNGQIIAVFTQRIDPTKEFSKILQYARINETDDIYAFDEKGILLTASRFEKQLRQAGILEPDQSSILNIEIKDPSGNLITGYKPTVQVSAMPYTLMAQSVLEMRKQSGHSSRYDEVRINVSGYRDYRGVPVFGIWKWHRKMGMGLTLEIDIDEALANYYSTRRTLFMVVALTLLLSVMTTLLTLIVGEQSGKVLQRAHDQLEEKVEERTEELLKKQVELEEATKAKSDFLANMSHEIRTPMNAVIGMAEVLKETELQPEQIGYLDTIYSAGENLLDIINSILDLSKIESGNLELESVPFSFSQSIETACEIMSFRSAKKNLELLNDIAEDIPDLLIGDPTRLRQIIINLIGNAVKFTDDGEIIVKSQLVSKENQHVELKISVQDTGTGIPDDKLDQIFESFSQADTTITRKYGGTGLGLTISKQLVKMMDGEILVESEIGQGSIFYFNAKFEKADETEVREQVDVSLFKGKRVFIIDDNQTNRLILKKILEHWGIITSEAEGGKEGIERITSDADKGIKYDMIILDYQMPGLSGIETLIELNKVPETRSKKIIISSMPLVLNDEEKDLNQIDFVIMKPVKRTELSKVLATVFAVHKTPSQIKEKTSSSELPPYHILMADDNQDNSNLIQIFLKKTPFKLTSVVNGAEAVEKFIAQNWDLVLMDMEMPVMDGLTATKKIRTYELKEKLETTPIIAFTAHAMKEHIDKCLSAGCTGHLSKPIKKKKLINTILEFTNPNKKPEENEQ
jgi:signal transduction histidine kinase/DNA-binding response OmpR family regulator/ABC-type amino acid transport substrate-binding protein